MQKTLRVESSAFTDGSPIPAKYTAKGDDVSPPLSWAGVHATIACFALVMDDPHAAGAPYIHWLAWNLTGTKLPENVSKEGEPATGGVQGTNSAKKVGYVGPAPPSGTRAYRFRVYALDACLDLGPDTDAARLYHAMQGHVVCYGELSGTCTADA